MKYLVLLFSCLFIFSCKNDQSKRNQSIGKYSSEDEPDFMEQISNNSKSVAGNTSKSTIEKGSKIIKSGSMKFEVSNLDKIKMNVDSMLSSLEGYYENEDFNIYGNRSSYNLVVRIPNKNFDALVRMLENDIGDLKQKNINANDVTEEYVDLNIRLENNLAYLKQYKTILTKAKTIKEILEVQEKIRNIEEEIESKKGRINFLDNKVNYSTLKLEISELLKGTVSSKPSFGRRAINAFNNGIQGFLTFIITLLNLWPFLLLIILIFLGRKPILNKLWNKK